MNRKNSNNPWVCLKLHNIVHENESDYEEEYCGNYSFIFIEDGSKKIKNNDHKNQELQKENFIDE